MTEGVGPTSQTLRVGGGDAFLGPYGLSTEGTIVTVVIYIVVINSEHASSSTILSPWRVLRSFLTDSVNAKPDIKAWLFLMKLFISVTSCIHGSIQYVKFLVSLRA